jgi:hypothetical protein
MSLLGKLFNPDNERKHSGLAEFVQNIYTGYDLTPIEAKNNLEQGLVELVWDNGDHCANGLLLTGHGYLITCLHCLADADRLRISFGPRLYRIMELCATNQERDLAIIRIDLRGAPRANRYRFCLNPPLSFGKKMPVAILTRNKAGLSIKGNFLEGRRNHGLTNACFYLCEQNSAKGDSGGILVTHDAALLGLHKGRSEQGSLSIKLFHILELIESYRAGR